MMESGQFIESGAVTDTGEIFQDPYFSDVCQVMGIFSECHSIKKKKKTNPLQHLEMLHMVSHKTQRVFQVFFVLRV